MKKSVTFILIICLLVSFATGFSIPSAAAVSEKDVNNYDSMADTGSAGTMSGLPESSSLYRFSYPQNIRAARTNNGSSVIITWDPVPNASYYSVYYKSSKMSSWEKIPSGIPRRDYNCFMYFTHCIQGEKYFFTVCVCDFNDNPLSECNPIGCSYIYRSCDIGSWSNVYRDFIMNKEYLQTGDFNADTEKAKKYDYINFRLIDFDNNDIPELVAWSGYIDGSSTSNNRFYVYTVKDKKLVYLGRILGDDLFCRDPFFDNKGVFCPRDSSIVSGRGVYLKTYFYYIDNDSIKQKEVAVYKPMADYNWSQGYVWSRGLDITVKDQELFDSYVNLTYENEYSYSTPLRFAKCRVFSSTFSEISSIGWESFLSN